MLGWLKSILGIAPRTATPPVESDDPSSDPTRRKIAPEDVLHVEAALNDLAGVGVELVDRDSLRNTAGKIVDELKGIFFDGEPTRGDWVLLALSGGWFVAFRNAICFDDHCFDGMTHNEYAEMIAGIVALAGDEWRFHSINVTNTRRRPAGDLDDWKPLTVTINADPVVAPFALTRYKDFDWSIIPRLNERLPKTAAGRFAICWGDHAHIVFLAPEKIQQLNSLCGDDCFSEEWQ